MREFLDDAQKHMTDGIGRASEKARGERTKKFYTKVDVVEIDSVYEIRLDGRSLKTPSKKTVAVPYQGLAQKIADEWDAQTQFIEPIFMPVSRIANAIIEGGEAGCKAVIDQIVEYAGNDLLLYRAEGPDGLVARQTELWTPVVRAVEQQLDVSFTSTQSIMPVTQPAQALDSLRKHISVWPLYAQYGAQVITTLTGSALLAVRHASGELAPDQVWHAAHVDEDYNWAQWGADGEAEARRAQRHTEFAAACFIVDLAINRD